MPARAGSTGSVLTTSSRPAAARRYLGAPLQHQGRVVSFDCVGLVLAVGVDLALADAQGRPILRADYLNYGAQPVDGFVETECRARLIEHGTEAARAEPNRTALRQMLEPGDVVTIRLPAVACHTGIVSTLAGEPALVHAYNGAAAKVIEHRLDLAWLRRISAVFSFPGIAD